MATGRADDELFNLRAWHPALIKFGEVTHLTVTLFDTRERVRCCEPAAPSSFFSLFQEAHFTPGILLDCARQCLAQAGDQQAPVVTETYGLAAVGTPLFLDDRIVGAAVAAYAIVDFCQSTTIAALARQAGVPFRRLWDLAQKQQPIPARRLILHGELLRVLCEAILRESHRTLQYEETAARLQTEAAAKDEFLAVLSHELRTPLTPILGWVRILEDGGGSPATRIKAAQSIKRNALLQIKLVDDLLDLNSVVRDKVSLDVAIHDLSDLIRSTIETVAETAVAKKVGLSFVEAREPLRLEGDAGRLQQVFSNVLSNAIKFTPPNGQVHVVTERADQVGVVRVSDTGEGIPAEFLPHVFDMFRQHEEGTRRRHTGLGIGLALVKRLVELHNGRVDVASRGVAQGTEVTIRLPLSTATGKPVHAGSQQLPGAALANLTILLVDDMEDLVETSSLMLEILGARVLTARNGREALAVLAAGSVDLVLCDLRMPEMDGFEFLREYSSREGAGHAPVVAMSGLATTADRDRTRAAGFTGHLKKPFDDTALVSIIRAAIESRHSPS